MAKKVFSIHTQITREYLSDDSLGSEVYNVELCYTHGKTVFHMLSYAAAEMFANTISRDITDFANDGRIIDVDSIIKL